MSRASAILELVTAVAFVTGCGALDESAPERGAVDQRLEPDATGWVDGSKTGSTGIQGQWQAWDAGGVRSSRVPDDFCATATFGECSLVEEPAPGVPYAPTPGLGMCTSGVIARWLFGSDGFTPDGSPGWAGIALELDQPFDAAAHGVTGFSFEIDAEPAADAGILVQVTRGMPGTKGSESTPFYWGGSRYGASPVHAGHNEFRWNEIGPEPFEPTELTSVAFLVSGSDDHAVSYDFCIDHLTALQSEAPPDPHEPPSVSVGELLEPDETGWVDRSATGTTRIQGAWITFSDGGESGTCRAAGRPAPECSSVVEPAPGEPFSPTPDLGMCVAGTVGIAVNRDGQPDWNEVWGASLALHLNEADPPQQGADPYDAARYGVTGFAFDIDSEPPPGAEIQVQFATPGTEASAAWWGGGSSMFSPVHAGHNEFRWDEVGGPFWQTEPPPPKLDISRLTELRFQVNANENNAVSYRFCIANLSALRN